MKVFKIVLTGGPRAGKSDILIAIKEHLEKKEDTQVIIVPETATLLSDNGIKPPKEKHNTLIFQDIVYTVQLAKENAAAKSIKMLPPYLNVYVIHDRGIMDNRAYLTDAEFENIIKRYNNYELRILDNYDLVFGLSSSAHLKGQYETNSNKARFESEKEAQILDKRTLNTWMLHRNYQIIDPTEDFNDKINIIKKQLDDFCEQKQKKYIKRFYFNGPFNLKVLDNYEYKALNKTQYFLNSYEENKLFIAERKSLNDYSSYTIKQKKYYEEFEEYYEDRTVPIHEFNDILDHNRIDSMHYLKTYTFIKDNQIWNLLLIDGQYFLEVETTIQHPDVILPKELCDAIPITNSTYYDLISELGYKRTLLK